MSSTINVDGVVWTTVGETRVRGHGFYRGEYVDSSGIASLVGDTTDPETLSEILSELNGFYGIVVDTAEETVIASDRMRTGPLFYTVVGDELYLSDECDWILRNAPERTWSKTSEAEYETARIVTSSHTLYDEIRQLQSGEIVVFDKEEADLAAHRHQIHRVTENEYSSGELRGRFEEVLRDTFERVVSMADGRPIFVPLSGGYDSRLIALMLKRVEYENVVTYTVDTSGSRNMDIAQKVAENLDYPWITARLTHADWKEFHESDEWDVYFDRAAYVGCLPHPTQVPALKKLKSRGEIPEDAIFVPGHSALDTMKATPPEFENQREIALGRLTDRIISQHYKYNESVDVPRDRIADRVAETIGLETPSAPESAREAFERWRLKERRTKLIVNGVRAFDFFGLDWWLPLEDRSLYEFWKKVPIESKRHRSFYEEQIERMYAETGNVSRREAGEDADSDLKSTVSHLLRGRSIWPLVRSSYDRWDRSRLKEEYVRRAKLEGIYESDPRYGIMTKEELRERYQGESYLFYSLLARATTDELRSPS